MWRRLIKLPKYLGKFGIYRGLAIFLSIERELPIRSERLQEHRLPRARAPLALRASRPDHSTFWQVMVMEQYEYRHLPQSKDLEARYERWVAAGKTPLIIDGGGNVGLAAIWFAWRFPAAKVVTVEPDSGNLDVLRRNIRHYENIEALPGALWTEKAWLRIQNPDSGAASFRVEAMPTETPDAIESYTIDEIAAREPGASLFLVKLDIEGAQKELFARNNGWVERCPLIVIELDDWQMPWQATGQSFFACTSRVPFDYLINGENLMCFRHGEAGNEI